jgi:hypothetical protein
VDSRRRRSIDVTIIQTISTTKDGTTTVDSRFVDAAATTLHAIDGDGRIVEATWHPRQRMLIELAAPPRLDRDARGSVAVAASQREQLARDLMALDARLQTRPKSEKKRCRRRQRWACAPRSPAARRSC